ncbi:MAG TPA: DUF6483 family protein [Longimicrobium sp.]|jgi:tetratricopeptide (TPR) repeat protein|uniref:DUF6483 family protein n=1 Tax=Longimicrobium sp. TaxID=2029185 RepID=UPI002EDA45E7
MTRIDLPPTLEQVRLKTLMMSLFPSERHIQKCVQEFRDGLSAADVPEEKRISFLAYFLADVASTLPHHTTFKLHLAAEAVAALEQLANGNADAERALADALGTLGNVLYGTGKVSQASTALKRALTLYQQMDPVQAEQIQSRIAGCMFSYARSLLALGKLEEALAHLYSTRDRQRCLAFGDQKWDQRNLAITLDLIPTVLRRLGRYDQAVQAHQESIAYGEALVAGGDDADFRILLANACDHFGTTLHLIGHVKEALEWHRKSLPTYEELFNAGLMEFARDIAVCLDNIGTALYGLKQYPESIQILRRSLEYLDTHPIDQNPETELLRAATLDHLGGTLQATRDFEAAARNHGAAHQIYSRWVAAGHRDREIDLAISAASLGTTELFQKRYEAAYSRLLEARDLLRSWVVEGFLYSREGDLARVWARLIECLQKMGRYASAENELWRALDVIPQSDEIFRIGTRFYSSLMYINEQDLIKGGLPRDEILQGFLDFHRRIAPYHSPTWRAAAAKARHLRATGGSLESAVSVLSDSAARWGESEPQAYLELGTFLFESGMYRNSYEAVSSALERFHRQLERERSGLRRRSDKDIEAGLSLAISAFRLARMITARDAARETSRLERAWILDKQLRIFEPWETHLSEAQRTEVAGLRRWLAEGYTTDLKMISTLHQMYEHNFEVLLEDRWNEVREQLLGLSQRVVGGDLDPDDAEREAGEMTASLAHSIEVQRRRQQSRIEVTRRLGVDPDTSYPELQSLVTALTVWSLLDRDVDSPKAVLSLVGTAVEGVLKTHVFLPYRAAVRRGAAQPTLLKGYFQEFLTKDDDKLMLGTMCELWHLLVTATAESCDTRIAGLVAWLHATMPNSGSLHDAGLDTLDAIRRLRNRGPHFGEAATADDVREMLHLTLSGPAALLPRVYAAVST